MKPLDPSVQPSRPEFDVHLTENVPIVMRDGVRLAIDVAHPICRSALAPTSSSSRPIIPLEPTHP